MILCFNWVMINISDMNKTHRKCFNCENTNKFINLMQYLILFCRFNIDYTKTSQPNFAQLMIYQVQMFG